MRAYLIGPEQGKQFLFVFIGLRYTVCLEKLLTMSFRLLAIFVLLAWAPLRGEAQDSACDDAMRLLDDKFGSAERFTALIKIDDAKASSFRTKLCHQAFSVCEFSFCSEEEEAVEGEEEKVIPLPVSLSSDPLAWLRQPMSCTFLIEQIRSRYAPLGKFSELPKFKQDEINAVMETACSARFEHCKFKACATAEMPKTGDEIADGTEQADGESSSSGIQEVLQRKADTLRSLVTLWQERRQERIQEAVAKEQESGITWGPFRVIVVSED